MIRCGHCKFEETRSECMVFRTPVEFLSRTHTKHVAIHFKFVVVSRLLQVSEPRRSTSGGLCSSHQDKAGVEPQLLETNLVTPQ